VRNRRRRRKLWGVLPGLAVLLAVSGISWWLYSRGDGPVETEPIVLAGRPAIATIDPLATFSPAISTPDIRRDGIETTAPSPRETPPAPSPNRTRPVPKRAIPDAQPDPAAPASPTNTRSAEPTRTEALIEAAKQALARDDLVAARSRYNEAWATGQTGSMATLVRGELSRIGNETVFSGRIVPGDPLVDRYVIKAGDHLAKIASQYGVTADLLAAINGIADKNRIREGQTIKVVKGPFRAVVHKKSYLIDVYLGEALLKSFPVGLGVDGSTPTGEWRIKNKLENPTYYPPRGGAIVAADDPRNPLGERWIGLEGVSGEAASQERYGIHGTNEPDSIGKSVSLGCIRMHNADVEQLYIYLVEGRSTVTVSD